ncbi:hypothetical protein C8R43DRAFT_910555, partial [Mycena crocata]
RPPAVAWWLGRARQWQKFVGIGELGSQGRKNTYINAWWNWWKMIQPEGREWVGGTLSMPDDCDWGTIAKLHGRNGLLQGMASLLWWGDKVGKGKDAMAHLSWTRAVGDVAAVLHELLRPGVIEKAYVCVGLENAYLNLLKGQKRRT